MEFCIVFFVLLFSLICVTSWSLEPEPAYEEQRTRVLRAGDRAECGVGCRQPGVEGGELRMVEGVMRVNTDGKGGMLPEGNVPHKTKVPYVLSGPVEAGARTIAQCVRRRD